VGVLVFLIILDIVVMAAVLYFVIREPQHSQPAEHPYLSETAASSGDTVPAQPAQADAE
jgi:preprotein translocase subunit YajC